MELSRMNGQMDSLTEKETVFDNLPGMSPVPMVKLPQNGPIFDIQPRVNPLLWIKEYPNNSTKDK